LDDPGNRDNLSASVEFLTTGETASLHSLLPSLLGEEGEVGQLRWDEEMVFG
jgi:hypothetical protein